MDGADIPLTKFGITCAKTGSGLLSVSLEVSSPRFGTVFMGSPKVG